MTTLRDILAKNGYPGELLDWFVTTDQPTRREGPRPCPLTLRVPWLGSKTEKLVRRANDAVRLAYPAGEVRAVYRTNKAFNLPKDRIPTQSPSNLIYQFECRQCGSRYVGKTAQRFVDRISQHVPKHVLDAVLVPQRERPGRPPKKRDNPAEGYQSAVACHLAANADCCRSYRESDFTVLSPGPSHGKKEWVGPSETSWGSRGGGGRCKPPWRGPGQRPGNFWKTRLF